ncbi:MAG: CPBP family intramembrane metalloprotease [Bacteroidia bacterium]|nr:CPBP family intramembrane metalloprotease [Bacteroidia bacterium]
MKENKLYNSLLKGGLATVVLTVLFLYYTAGRCSSQELLLAVPFFLIFYFVQFVLGWESVIQAFVAWNGRRRWNVLIFPTVLLALYFIYLELNGQNILEGNPALLLYTIYFPVLVYGLVNDQNRKIGWIDFSLFVLALFPFNFFSLKQNSDLPINGSGFDAISHVMIILSGVYVFAIVRGLKEVGFVPEIRWKSLRTALLVWLSFYAFVFVFGRSVNFITVIGYSDPVGVVIKTILFTMIGTFLHTALFEELFFRGILQNMLTRRIGQGKSWLVFWMVGFVLLLIGAFAVGYTLEGKMKWFPAFVTVVLFTSAYFLEKSEKFGLGVYTSLAITGVTFGLVHYHAKSIIYIGLACVAGWAYGYTYIKTKNVFYSALVHTLVNTGTLIFGLKMMR